MSVYHPGAQMHLGCCAEFFFKDGQNIQYLQVNLSLLVLINKVNFYKVKIH